MSEIFRTGALPQDALPRRRNRILWLRVAFGTSDEETIMTKLIAFIAAVLLSVTAFAGDDKEKKDPSMKSSAVTFDALDKNGDAQLSKTEAAADKTLADSFASADSNGDGYLSKTEFTARTKS